MILDEYRELLKEKEYIENALDNVSNEELALQYKLALETIEYKRLEIERLIEVLEPTERMLIRYRFFEGLKWNLVFKKLHYSKSQTFRMYTEILTKLGII